tara:strand:+ start:1433 stop:1918 length:486 start_codon:yes stop_codon:yes gene_type:complete
MAYSTTPTATASLTISTSGYTSSDVSVSNRMQLHDITHGAGCKRSTGLKRVLGTNNSNAGILVFDTSSYTAASASATRGRGYLYIANPNTTTKGTRKFSIYETDVSGALLCELFEGDFIYMPVTLHDGADITVLSTDDTWPLEYMVIYEGADAGYIPGQEL